MSGANQHAARYTRAAGPERPALQAQEWDR